MRLEGFKSKTQQWPRDPKELFDEVNKKLVELFPKLFERSDQETRDAFVKYICKIIRPYTMFCKTHGDFLSTSFIPNGMENHLEQIIF